MVLRIDQQHSIFEAQVSFRIKRRICFDGNKRPIRPGLHPPRPTVCIYNDLLSRASVSDAPRDRVGLLPATLCGCRDLGEFDRWAGAVFRGMASLRCETKGPNKDKRPCQLFRRNAYRAPCGASGVPSCEHVRPQTVSADDTVVGYSEQTPMEAPLGKPEGYFMIQFPGRTAWNFVFEPSSSTSSTTRISANATNTLNSPLLGYSTQTLASSLGPGAPIAASTPSTKSVAPAPSSSPSSSNSSSTATLGCVGCQKRARRQEHRLENHCACAWLG